MGFARRSLSAVFGVRPAGGHQVVPKAREDDGHARPLWMNSCACRAATSPALARQVAHARETLALIEDIEPEAAQWVEEARSKRSKKPSVVVVGETKPRQVVAGRRPDRDPGPVAGRRRGRHRDHDHAAISRHRPARQDGRCVAVEPGLAADIAGTPAVEGIDPDADLDVTEVGR